MKNLPTILILGATGKTGSRVAQILEENGVTVRRVSHYIIRERAGRKIFL